ncbi:MAG: hypothetical protein ACK4U0_16540 [Mesorhizobium sp.]
MTIRNTIIATAAALVAATAGTATFAGQFVAMPASGGGAAINCSIPNNVVCTITSAKGLKSVRINSNTPQGTIAVVNKNYRNCPKSVQVSWDSAYQASSTQIVECSGAMGLKSN